MSAFGSLAELRETPINAVDALRVLKQGCRLHPIDLGHSTAEPLVDLRALGVAAENHYFNPRNPPYWRRIEGSVEVVAVRIGVAEKLERINARLAPQGLELFVFDGWRPRAVQAYFHDVWAPAQIARSTGLAGEALWREVDRYWSPPTSDPRSPAPHSTGAAVDLTLRWIGANHLWMGSIFDDITTLANRDHFESGSPLTAHSDLEARANRRLLHWLMVGEGFVGDPDEWWHFSWGDQAWAKVTGAAAARYGLAAWSG